jgi:hypothetical protein
VAGLRILIVAGDPGSEHPTVAATLAEQLRARPEVEAVALIDDPSGVGTPAARRLSRTLPGRAGALAGAAFGHRALAASLNAFGAHVVVSESPGLTAVLAQLRSLARLPLPLVAVIPDGADPRAGAAPGVDMHLVFTPDAVATVAAIAGPGTAMAVQPLVDPQFLDAPARGAARGYVARQLKVSLKGGRPLVLISGNGDGRSDALADAAEVATDTVADAVAVVIAGDHPELESALHTRFAGSERVRVLGVAERRATLLAAADVLIDTAGGAAALEARLVGCPRIGFGASAHAHAHFHADASADGVEVCAHSRAELGPVLTQALARERPTPPELRALARAVDVVIATAYGTQRPR